MSKQTTKKIEKLEIVQLIDYYSPELTSAQIQNEIHAIKRKLNQIIDHINKEGKHE